MPSEGDEIDVNDFGICKLNEDGKYSVHLVEEEDGSINWYINPNNHSDTILTTKKVNYVKER